MSTDAWLAIAHHLAIFGVFAVLVAEWTIVRPGIDAADVHTDWGVSTPPTARSQPSSSPPA